MENKLFTKAVSLLLAAGILFTPLTPLWARMVSAANLQTIEVCYITIDHLGAVKQTLPSGTSVELDLYESVHLVEGADNSLSGPFQTATHSNGQMANRDVLGNDGIYDSYCQALQYSYAAGHEFAYTQARLFTSNPNVQVVGYNDQFNIQVQTTADVLPYSNNFFDGIPGNEAGRNINADGHIIMSSDREYRHLITVIQDNTIPESSEPPVIAIALNQGAASTDNTLVDLGLTADHANPLQYIRFAATTDQLLTQNWADYSLFDGSGILPLSNTEGEKTICVQVQDAAGLVSNIACDSIIYDLPDAEEPPVDPEPTNPNPASGFIRINQDAIFTNSAEVVLNLSQAGAVPKYVRLTQTDNGAPAPAAPNVFSPSDPTVVPSGIGGWTYWQNYGETAQWNLSGSFGTKTVYAQYMYQDDTTGAINTDSIIYAPYYAISYNSVDHSTLSSGVYSGQTGSSYEQILPEYTFNNVPASLNTGEKIKLKFTAANTGSYTWKQNQVNVTYYWEPVNVAAEYLPYINPEQRGGNAVLSSAVAYSSSTGVLSMEVAAPAYPGTYKLRIDTIDEGIAKFSQFNNPTLEYTVDIFQTPGTQIPSFPELDTPPNAGAAPFSPVPGEHYVIQGYVRYADYRCANFPGVQYMILESTGSGAYWCIYQHDIGQYVNQEIKAPVVFTDWNGNFNLIGWDGIPVSAPSETIVLRPGDSLEIEVRYQNTGYHFWQPTNPGGAGAPNGGTRLGLQQSTASKFYDAGTWLDAFRIRMANTQAVRYGDVARFRFELQAPNNIAPGLYRECFRPVIEAVTWISDESRQICVNVQITNQVEAPVNNFPLPPAPSGNTGYIIRFAGSDLLAGPTAGFPSTTHVQYGEAVTVIGEATIGNSHWVQVRDSGGNEGWIPAGSVDYVNDPPNISFALNNTYIANYVCGGTLTVRSGPGAQYGVVQVLPWGTTTYVLNVYNGWNLVSLPNGQTGWAQAGSQLCAGTYAPSYGGGLYGSGSGNVAGQTYFNGQVYSRPLTPGSYTISQGYQDGHYATDYAAACGTPIFSVADGVVSQTQSGFGNTYTTKPLNPIQKLIAMNSVNMVVINHDNGTQSTYLHLQEVSVSPGQRVARGQQIGTVGNSGWSTGCHLHMSLGTNQDVYGPKLDPESVFNQQMPVGLISAANTIRAREVAGSYGRAPAPNGQLHQHCGAYIQDYYWFLDPGQSWQTYTNLIYNPSTGGAYRLRGDIRIAYWDKYQGTCGTLGIPTTDDLWAATSQFGTSGAYQQFDNGTIHSSYKGTFATTGLLNQMHASLGGTASAYGFPVGEEFSESGNKCQWFEGGVLCEQEMPLPEEYISAFEGMENEEVLLIPDFGQAVTDAMYTLGEEHRQFMQTTVTPPFDVFETAGKNAEIVAHFLYGMFVGASKLAITLAEGTKLATLGGQIEIIQELILSGQLQSILSLISDIVNDPKILAVMVHNQIETFTNLPYLEKVEILGDIAFNALIAVAPLLGQVSKLPTLIAEGSAALWRGILAVTVGGGLAEFTYGGITTAIRILGNGLVKLGELATEVAKMAWDKAKGFIAALPLSTPQRAFMLIKAAGGKTAETINYFILNSSEVFWLETGAKGGRGFGWNHILERHVEGMASTVGKGDTFPIVPLTEIQESIFSVLKGSSGILESNGNLVFERLVGFSDGSLKLIRVVTSQTGKIITAYPVSKF